MKEEKVYIRNNGEKVFIKDMNTEHLVNSLAKKYRELFESTNKDDYSRRLAEINDLKEDLYKRFNVFYETMEEK